MNFLLEIRIKHLDERFLVVELLINILNHLLNPKMYMDNNEQYNTYHPNEEIPMINK
jgi:hypothetical protein